MNILNEIDSVFHLEIDTLVKTRSTINEVYAKAIELLFDCRGKVVVTGAGKSGLIAQKIASTMVSTGTPAVFLHPSDGTHGDVGIIQEGDVVLALSKSGETEELLSLLLYVKKISVPVISITANAQSALAKSSDLVLHTPVDVEACPLNLAPTSSTTVALVVGDGLAMALMKKREFTDEHFALFHPGGQLGKRLLLNVSDIMRSGEENPVINIDHSVQQMLFEITSKRSGAVSVVDGEGRLIGLVTDSDIRKILEQGKNIFLAGIGDIMNSNPTYIYSDAKAMEAMDLMENRGRPFVVLPVLGRKNNIAVGMIHLHDLIAKGL
jgi:arabinose-5-phosphate isomerase